MTPPPFQAIPPTADNLADLLRRHGITPSEFATHCGVSHKTVYNWLQGIYPMKAWVGVVMGWVDHIYLTKPEPE